MDHEDVLTGVGAAGSALSLILIGIRFYARHMSRSGIGWDDWLILLSFFSLIAADTLIIVANSVNPEGADIASNKDPTYEYTEADIEYTKLNYIATIIYYTIVSSTKLSIILMYNRLFSVSTAFRYQVIFMCLLTGAFWIATTITNILSCIPMKYTWINADEDPRYCINYNLYWLGSGIAESVIDFLIIIMPVRVVYRLRMSRGRKIAVVAVFLLGVFVIMSGVVKVILSYIPGSRNPDFSLTALWTTVHVCTGIICACLPVCWPVFVRMSRFRFSSSSSPSWSLKIFSSGSAWSEGSRNRRSSRNQRRASDEIPVSGRTITNAQSADSLRVNDFQTMGPNMHGLGPRFTHSSHGNEDAGYELTIIQSNIGAPDTPTGMPYPYHAYSSLEQRKT
ncbi:unnamed protein product [Clonostachys byssicola]|uniref:Rhodopsin domain-containing protein n=1 Tax=Clonostachys byssicola TaxID=160290 RepID=A0A9N9XWU6_9HYPO|nr:unnamed protein product [Clonostachys byssicola]